MNINITWIVILLIILFFLFKKNQTIFINENFEHLIQNDDDGKGWWTNKNLPEIYKNTQKIWPL